MSDSIKLYLDEDTLSRDLVKALRARSVDLLTAKEVGLIHIPDGQHLAYAASLGRAVVTHNTRDYARLHAEYLAAGKHHAGIIASDQVQVGVLLRRLLKLLNARSAADLHDVLEYLNSWH
jgi:hypothetical protein